MEELLKEFYEKKYFDENSYFEFVAQSMKSAGYEHALSGMIDDDITRLMKNREKETFTEDILFKLVTSDETENVFSLGNILKVNVPTEEKERDEFKRFVFRKFERYVQSKEKKAVVSGKRNASLDGANIADIQKLLKGTLGIQLPRESLESVLDIANNIPQEELAKLKESPIMKMVTDSLGMKKKKV